MTKCIGIMGWLFGHKFIPWREYQTRLSTFSEKDIYPLDPKYGEILLPHSLKYYYKCKRCGAKCDE